MDNRFEKSPMPQGPGNKSNGQFRGAIKNLVDKPMTVGKDSAVRGNKEASAIQEKLGSVNAVKMGGFLKSNWKPVLGGAALLSVVVAGVVFLFSRSVAKISD